MFPALPRTQGIAPSVKLESLGYSCEVDNPKQTGSTFEVPQRRRRLCSAGIEAWRTRVCTDGKQRIDGASSHWNLPLLNEAVIRCTIISPDGVRGFGASSGRIPRTWTAVPGFNDQLPGHKRLDCFRDVYGRMAWDKPAPTITGGCINPSKGRFIHPQANRAITLREAACFKRFPEPISFR